MFNLNYITKEDINENDPNRPQITDQNIPNIPNIPTLY